MGNGRSHRGPLPRRAACCRRSDSPTGRRARSPCSTSKGPAATPRRGRSARAAIYKGAAALRCPGLPAAVYLRLAVLYDYLETIGGGERVALTLSQPFDADLVTTAYDETPPAPAGYGPGAPGGACGSPARPSPGTMRTSS